MYGTYKVFTTVHLNPGYTKEQAALPADAFVRVYETEVRAVLESEAFQLAEDQVMDEIRTPKSDPLSHAFSSRAVRLDPLRPLEPEFIAQISRKHERQAVRFRLWNSGEPSCTLCNGLGFLPDPDQLWVFCRCPECNRFRDDEAMFEFIYSIIVRLAAAEDATVASPGSSN